MACCVERLNRRFALSFARNASTAALITLATVPETKAAGMISLKLKTVKARLELEPQDPRKIHRPWRCSLRITADRFSQVGPQANSYSHIKCGGPPSLRV